MELKQIADLLNTIKMPNSLGEVTTIADDLSNVDEGIDLSNLTDDTVKDYNGKFAVGVVNIFRNEADFSEETFGLYHNEMEYGGLLQVTRNRGRLKAHSTPILTLESINDNPNAPDYTDGHYYGPGLDVKVYDKDVADELRYSIPNEMFKQSFTGPEDVMKLVAMIQKNYTNTMASMLKELARSILITLIKDCSATRRIHLLTQFNTINGYQEGDDGYVTISNYRRNIQFRLFAQEVQQGIMDYMTDYNKKYNDGSVEIFANKSDIRTIVLSDFARQMEFTQGLVYNPDKTAPGNFTKINYWQNASTDLFPTISATSVHDQVVIDNGEGVDDTVINHVVSLTLDKFTAGITNKLLKSRAKYVEEGDFTTIFTAIVKKYWVDNRDMAVICTLD